jgi:hypothetical protein
MSDSLLFHRLRVFENRVLRRILRLKMDEMIGGSKRLHNEESSRIRTMKSRSMVWEGNVARMG